MEKAWNGRVFLDFDYAIHACSSSISRDEAKLIVNLKKRGFEFDQS